MRTCLIDACHEQTDAVWAFAVVLGISLGAVTDGGDEALDRDCAAVG